jgi:hypothetical protein
VRTSRAADALLQLLAGSTIGVVPPPDAPGA